MSEQTADDDAGRTERRVSLSPFAYKVVFYLVLLLWGGYLYLQTLDWTSNDRQFAVLVLAILFGVGILKIGQLVADQYGLVEFESSDGMMSAVDTDDGEEIPPAAQEKFEVVMISSIVITAVAVYYLGFLNVLPWTVLALTYYLTRDLVRSTITAVVFFISIFVLFRLILGIRIFPGILFL
jgi:hypothetical protein